MNIGLWVKDARQHAERTQQQVADYLGLSKSNISGIEHGRHKISIERMVELGKWCNYPLPVNVTGGKLIAATKTRDVPLLEWHDAEAWSTMPHEQLVAGIPMVQTSQQVSLLAFALQQKGDSMEPRIPSGGTIIIDPKIEPVHGKIALVKRPEDQYPILRQIVEEGNTTYLRPLNERYPMSEMTKGSVYLGIAVEVQVAL